IFTSLQPLPARQVARYVARRITQLAGHPVVKPDLATVAMAAVLALSCAPSLAQCQFSWLPGAPNSGPNGPVNSMLLQSNGDVLAGGDFTLADDQFARSMARFDGTSWQPLGQGIDGTVYTVVELPNG